MASSLVGLSPRTDVRMRPSDLPNVNGMAYRGRDTHPQGALRGRMQGSPARTAQLGNQGAKSTLRFSARGGRAGPFSMLQRDSPQPRPRRQMGGRGNVGSPVSASNEACQRPNCSKQPWSQAKGDCSGSPRRPNRTTCSSENARDRAPPHICSNEQRGTWLGRSRQS